MNRAGRAAIVLGIALGSAPCASIGWAQDHTKPAAAASADVTTPTVNRRDAEAHALFSAGANALADGRFEEALDCFERSYKLSGRPEILYNIGIAQDRLRHDREAAHAFEAYLKLSPDKDRRADARARLKVLKRAIGKGPALPAPRDAGSERADTLGPTAAYPASASPVTAYPGAPSGAPASAAADRDAGTSPSRPGQRTVVAAPPPSSPIEESPLLRGL